MGCESPGKQHNPHGLPKLRLVGRRGVRGAKGPPRPARHNNQAWRIPFCCNQASAVSGHGFGFSPTRDWCSPRQSHHGWSSTREPASVVGPQGVGRLKPLCARTNWPGGTGLEPYPDGPALPRPALGVPRFAWDDPRNRRQTCHQNVPTHVVGCFAGSVGCVQPGRLIRTVTRRVLGEIAGER